MIFETLDLTPCIGTEVRTDAATLLSGVRSSQIRNLLEQRGVLVFREINLTNEQQVAFAETLGEVIPQGEKGIFKITMDKNENEGAEYLRGSFFWHVDGAMDDKPSRASLLSARRLSDTGGQTEFANTYASFEGLPRSEQEKLEKLRVIHTFESSQRMVTPEPTWEQVQFWRNSYASKSHSLVWRHLSGRKSLVLGASTSHIEGMDYREGQDLLCRLRDWATRPQFVYRHEWTPGDLVIWDNTGTMHRVLPYAFDSGRMMHRTTLVGEELLN